MNWQEFTALLVLATAMSFTPGPNTTLATALAANGGLRGAMRFVVAVPFGWSLLLLLTAGGLGALVTAVPAARLAVKALGIAYLLWLAFKLSQSGRLGQADGARMQVGFWQGVGLQFVNIKAWLLALAIVAGWVAGKADAAQRTRSEEHTSELQSRENLVCRLLLEKKKKKEKKKRMKEKIEAKYRQKLED